MLLLEFGEREPKSQQHKTDREHHVYHPTTKQMSHDMTACYSLWTRQDITCILYQIPVGSFHGMEKNIENILSRRLMPTIFSCFPQMPISFRPLSPECEYRSRKTWNLLQFRTVWFVFRYIILTKRYSYVAWAHGFHTNTGMFKWCGAARLHASTLLLLLQRYEFIYICAR